MVATASFSSPSSRALVCRCTMIAVAVCLLGAVIYLQWCALAITTVNSQLRVFEIDYENDRFLKDGEPFRYVSGSLHYFRVPRVYWRDRLRKYRAAGLNAVCTYIEWSLHEPSPGVYDFEGDKDVEYFIRLAQQEGLLVILRPGPYICSERDLGGYPVWLYHENPSMRLRTSDPSHTKYVHSWLRVLLPRIQPLLYSNGGPVIMVQVENEYGSYSACDRAYTHWLRDLARDYLGYNTVLFTTDGNGAGYLKCGPIPGVFTTVDFGPVNNVTKAFEPLRAIQPHGPLVNSEFYPGWLTHWGDPGQSKVTTDSIVNATRQLLALNASFNYYMFHGGTNFGFTSGANSPPFQPQITSYDFNAPISESGNLTDKYYAIKYVLSEYMPVENLAEDSSYPVNYGTILMSPKISLFDSDTGLVYGDFTYPQTFESLQLYSGFMLYETSLPPSYEGRGFLQASNVHDRTIVYIDQEPVGVLSRTDSVYSLVVADKGGQTLGLLVENQGHINYGNMSDLKGITNNVTLEGNTLTSWRHTGYPMVNVSHIPALPSVRSVRLPAFYAGNFQVPETPDPPRDTFVDMTGWGKGVLYINNINLGRYWPTEGPQVTLYLPGSFLRRDNTVLLMELEREHRNRTISFVAEPVIHGTVTKLFSHNTTNPEPISQNTPDTHQNSHTIDQTDIRPDAISVIIA